MQLGSRIHQRLEGRIDRLLNVWPGPEAGAQRHPLRPGSFEDLVDTLVDPNVRAPKSIDGLLWIANDEEFPRDGSYESPVADGRIVSAQKQKDFGLERIGVLELVHENTFEALLKAVGGPRGRV